MDFAVKHSPQHFVRAAALAFCSLWFAGCSSTSELAETRGLAPCPITLAIGDFAGVSPAAETEDAIAMQATSVELQQLLADSLGKVRAASRVVRLSEIDAQEADIVLRPRLAAPVTFRYEGWSSSWWASGGLWLVTWIGGMAVDDSTYQSNMVVDCDLVFTGSQIETTRREASGEVDLSFLERNDFFSWPTVQSLILPPFLTSDQSDSTRQALTQRAVDDVAVRLARYLKQNFEQDALEADFCGVKFDSPINGAEIGTDSVLVSGLVRSKDPISAIRVFVNQSKDPLDATIIDLDPPDENLPESRRFRCEVPGLQAGDNWIRVLVASGDPHHRTLLVKRN